MAHCGDVCGGEQPEIPGAKIATLTRPPRWTQVYSWKLARFSLTDPDQDNSDTVFEVRSSGRPNLFQSLRLARAGAICQGVHTSGSLTMDGGHRVRAYMDRWHCRQVAQRYSSILASLLEYLTRSVRKRAMRACLERWKEVQPPRPLLRPRSYVVVHVYRRKLLRTAFGAWTLAVSWAGMTSGAVAPGGDKQIGSLLLKKKTRLQIQGMEHWKRAVVKTKDENNRKAASFHRWRLLVLLSKDWIRLRPLLSGRRWRQVARRTARTRSVMCRMCRLSARHVLLLKHQAFDHWKCAEKLPQIDSETATGMTLSECEEKPAADVCRCVRCFRRFGRMGKHANRSRPTPNRFGGPKDLVACQSHPNDAGQAGKAKRN